MVSEIQHRENEKRGVFLIEGDSGIISELSYAKKEDNVIVIDHTETKRDMENRGYASKLMEYAVKYARDKNLKIEPLCPFAEVKFEQHPEYRDVLAQ